MRMNRGHLVFSVCVGVIAVLLVLACAGTAMGVTWVVDDDGGADYASMQTVEAAA